MMRFEGILPALVTPLTENEDLNVPALQQLLEHLLAEGANGFYVGGATGECIALKESVRRQLAAETVRILHHRAPCVLHIAATDLHQAIDLAKQAEACGADGISAIPPLFFKYDQDDVFNYYKALADAVQIPLMVYYNPNAGFAINAAFAARLFQIENVTAIKWTSPDYYGMMRLKDLTHGEMNIINGPDEMLLMGLSAGADGGIGTTYNIMLPRFLEIYRQFKKNNMDAARQMQTETDRIIEALLRYEVIPATKAVLEMQGFAVGNASFPMKRYTQAEKEQIYRTLLSAGL